MQVNIGLSDQPEALVAGTFLLEVLGKQVRVHLRLEERHAGPVSLIDVLGGFRVELECCEDDDFWFRDQKLRLLDSAFDLSLL